jgi:hypothetical protein
MMYGIVLVEGGGVMERGGEPRTVHCSLLGFGHGTSWSSS